MNEERNLPYGIKPIPQEVQDKYKFITWERLIEGINDYLPKGFEAGWDFTGGGCSGILIFQSDDQNGIHKSHIRITDSDVPSISDYQKEVDINCFTVGVHNAESCERIFEEGMFTLFCLEDENIGHGWADNRSELKEDNELHNLQILIDFILETVATFNPTAEQS
tara:strand:- start:1107 stop:1601 length:495 start_codon:yes stop_codon:yes gene_type:complete